MATLTGWAIAIGATGADHTYVTSSDGYVWPCWGRSSGGHPICSGVGSSASANCFSQTSSQAGILYALTGVCHQTANRILFPARAIVSAAGGYWASVLLYGTYGTSTLPSLIEWEVRKGRCGGVASDMMANARGVVAAGAAAQADPALQAYLAKVNGLYAAQAQAATLNLLGNAAQPDILGQELKLMADYRLADAAPDMAPLQGEQASTLARKAVLDQQLISKHLTPAEYAQQVNALLGELLSKSVSLLGEKTHTQLFGVAPGASIQLVDSDILAGLH